MHRSLTVPRTRPGRVLDRVLHVESKHWTSVSFCYVSNIDIFQYVTHCSSGTRQNTLYHEHVTSRTYTCNILVSEETDPNVQNGDLFKL